MADKLIKLKPVPGSDTRHPMYQPLNDDRPLFNHIMGEEYSVGCGDVEDAREVAEAHGVRFTF
jgi:hypothetical protein